MAEYGKAYMVECPDICCVARCGKLSTHTVYNERGELVGRFCVEDAEAYVNQLNDCHPAVRRRVKDGQSQEGV